MEIVRTLDRTKAIDTMKERGYELVASSGNEDTFFFVKNTNLGVNIHATVCISKMNISLELLELKLCCKLQQENFSFYHKEFDRFEKVIYLYSEACLKLGDVFERADKMDTIESTKDKIELIIEPIPAKPKKKVVPTIDERKKDFWDQIRQVGKEKGYDKEMCLEFYKHWTEMNPGAKTFRKEQQKIFDIKKRLVTWLNNNVKWSKPHNTRYEKVLLDQQKALEEKGTTVIDKTTMF